MPAGTDLIGQVFDPLGPPVAGELLVNGGISVVNERLADVAAVPDGGLTAVYQGVDSATGTFSFDLSI